MQQKEYWQSLVLSELKMLVRDQFRCLWNENSTHIKHLWIIKDSEIKASHQSLAIVLVVGKLTASLYIVLGLLILWYVQQFMWKLYKIWCAHSGFTSSTTDFCVCYCVWCVQNVCPGVCVVVGGTQVLQFPDQHMHLTDQKHACKYETLNGSK